MEAATVQLRKVEEIVYLLIERYDRQHVEQTKHTERIHQEDFCQALAIPPWQKYQQDGGPKLRSCFTLLNQTAVPALERNKLLNAVIFNFLISNFDAHGKNFSLLHAPDGIQLAPLYDLICTGAFPDFNQSFAMDIGDEFLTEDVNAHQWRTLCEDIGYSFPAFKKRANSMLQKLPAAMTTEYGKMQDEGWAHKACEATLEIVKNNCNNLGSKLSA